MLLRGEEEARRLAKPAHLHVVLGPCAHRHRGIREVGDVEENGLLLGIHQGDALLQLLDGLAHRPHVRAHRLELLGLGLARSLHLFVGRVAALVEGLQGEVQRPAFLLERQKGTEVERDAAGAQPLHHRVGRRCDGAADI